jgi:hypothetical protein
MSPKRLRIPLALTWSALAGAMVNASEACSSSSQSGGYPDAAGEAMAMDAPADATETSTSNDARDGDVAMEAAPAPAECIVEKPDASLYVFTADGATCPDGDIMV